MEGSCSGCRNYKLIKCRRLRNGLKPTQVPLSLNILPLSTDQHQVQTFLTYQIEICLSHLITLVSAQVLDQLGVQNLTNIFTEATRKPNQNHGYTSLLDHDPNAELIIRLSLRRVQIQCPGEMDISLDSEKKRSAEQAVPSSERATCRRYIPQLDLTGEYDFKTLLESTGVEEVLQENMFNCMRI